VNAIAERQLVAALRHSKKFLKSNRVTRKLLDDVVNRDEFSSLSSHEEMIRDSARVDTYYEGIKRHIRPGDVVVDLGTGTGILAFFAREHGARKVYAIDHSDILHVAETLAAHNGITDVEFVQLHSKQFTAPEQLDVILHEQMGDDLFNEHMIDSILDLKRRLLKPAGKILPARFQLFFEPISLQPEQRLPYLWEQQSHGIDFSVLKGMPGIENFQGANYGHRFVRPMMLDHLLCEPEPMLTFDLNTLGDINELPHVLTAERVVARAGSLDGICVYFRTLFDDDLSFSTSPLDPMTSWSNRVFRTETREYQVGDRISYRVEMPDLAFGDTWAVTMG